ncbi:unnamed protein product [Rotaria sp. Silwood1]|nr:unnamed protein product [Rotaria sp. Silwood1]
MEKTLVTKSTGLEPTTFPHAKGLVFDSHLPMKKIHLDRFTHTRMLIMKEDLDISFEYIIRCIDFSWITTFIEDESNREKSSKEFVQILHNIPRLRSLCLNISTLIVFFDQHWPQIIELTMNSNSCDSRKSLSSIEIDVFWYSFIQLERLAFDRQCIRKLSRLLNNMTMTLSDIWIHYHDNLDDSNPPLITRQWLEQNTDLCNFDYFYDNKWDVH